MSGVLHLEVTESADTLEQLLKHQRDAIKRSKVQVLWWLKTGQATQVNELAERSGYHRVTISRWLSCYRQQGLERLLVDRPRKGGRPPVIDGEVRRSLEQELQDPHGFSSYLEVQKWLAAVWGIQVPYKTVHHTVRYQLKAKLKRPRPVASQQQPEAVETFKKTLVC